MDDLQKGSRRLFPGIFLAVLFAGTLSFCGCSSFASRLTSADHQVRAAALKEIKNMDAKSRGKAALRMTGIAVNKKSKVRDFALDALEELGDSSVIAAPRLINALNDYSISFRVSRMLGKLDSATPELVAALKKTDFGITNDVQQILAARGARVVPSLVAALAGADPLFKKNIAQTLGYIGPAAKEAVPALVQLMKEDSGDVRTWAGMAIEKIGDPATDWLLNALADPDPAVRADAARVLSGMFPPPTRSISRLFAAMKDESAEVRRLAADAVAVYALSSREPLPENSVTVLLPFLKDTDAKMRYAVISIMGNFAARNSEAFAALTAALEDPDAENRICAAGQLRKLGASAQGALPALLKSLKSEARCVRAWSALAIITIEPALQNNKDVADSLQKAEREACLQTMSRIEPLSVEILRPDTDESGNLKMPE